MVSRMQNRRGTQAEFDNLYPAGQPGSGTEILQPGEIALCTDTLRVFVGNLNGTFFELTTGSGPTPPPSPVENGHYNPLVLTLPPQATPTLISPLTYTKTPFFTLIYSLSDAASIVDANTVGTNFSKNGSLAITAITNFAPLPPNLPFPTLKPVTLTDTGTEINTTEFDISFSASYDVTGNNIEISYMHNFPGNLTFSTSSIIWTPI